MEGIVKREFFSSDVEGIESIGQKDYFVDLQRRHSGRDAQISRAVRAGLRGGRVLAAKGAAARVNKARRVSGACDIKASNYST